MINVKIKNQIELYVFQLTISFQIQYIECIEGKIKKLLRTGTSQEFVRFV